jgi:FixJ family two-component response regulator
MEPTDRPSVAIVDDDELFRRSIEGPVRSAGFRIDLFGAAEDLLERGDLGPTG